jgi:hypothetical protein
MTGSKVHQHLKFVSQITQSARNFNDTSLFESRTSEFRLRMVSNFAEMLQEIQTCKMQMYLHELIYVCSVWKTGRTRNSVEGDGCCRISAGYTLLVVGRFTILFIIFYKVSIDHVESLRGGSRRPLLSGQRSAPKRVVTQEIEG